jgi:hypothetical protein
MVAQLAAEVEALRGHSEGAQEQLAAREAKFGRLDRAEADAARVASAVGQLRGDVGALKNWTDWIHSLILCQSKA